MKDKIEILKVLVGSHAHGLASPESDYDYRSVYITPTSELLKLVSTKYNATSWIEGDGEDNTAYEIGHFLHLASKSNPSILEVFKAPIIHYGDKRVYRFEDGDLSKVIGKTLRDLFPHVWSSKGVYEAFKGYSHNQHKKMFDDREELSERKGKYAVAHIRVLLEGIELLTTNNFNVQILHVYLHDGLHIHLPPSAVEYLKDRDYKEETSENKSTCSWKNFLKEIKKDEHLPTGVIVDTAEYLKDKLKKAYETNPNKTTDMDKVNEFLLKIRREVW